MIFALWILLTLHIYLGTIVWRLSQNGLLRMYVYLLLHDVSIQKNFMKKHAHDIVETEKISRLCLSWMGVLWIIFAWPLVIRKYHKALKHSAYMAKLLGDESTEKVSNLLRQAGFQQADVSEKKSESHFCSGFLVRRLDPDLVAVFHYSTHDTPTEGQRKLNALSNTLIHWGKYPSTAVGISRTEKGKSLPYVVVYEPFAFGHQLELRHFRRIVRNDFNTLKKRMTFGGPSKPSSTSQTSRPRKPQRAPLPKHARLKAQRAMNRFFVTRLFLAGHKTESAFTHR